MKQTTTFLKMKEEKDPIVMITAYDYPTAKLVEASDVDMILVGDSLGMVVLGYESTVPVTVDDMIHHTKAVKRGAKNTFIVTDMPFMSYHLSIADSLFNARRIIQEGGAHALKVEGANDTLEVIQALTHAGVPVVGHLGLTPQSVGVLGGYKVQGKDLESAKQLLNDALAVQAAGAFALVLECVPHQLAQKISEMLRIPVIGIGAGCDVDGQVLVFHDVVGYGVDRVPKFVKQYANINDMIVSSIYAYRDEVKNKTFPEKIHSFTMNEDQLLKLYGGKES